MAFFKVNLLFERVGLITPLEIKILWLPANRGKYEEMSCSSFLLVLVDPFKNVL